MTAYYVALNRVSYMPMVKNSIFDNF